MCVALRLLVFDRVEPQAPNPERWDIDILRLEATSGLGARAPTPEGLVVWA